MSDLTLKKRKNLQYTPEVIGYLATAKEFEYSYKYYKIRHPGGIFNLATNYVVNDFLDLLKELEEHQNDYQKDRKIELEKKFRNLINNFFKFYDSCFEIIQGCCKKHNHPSEKEALWQWLKKNRYDSGEIFHNTTKNEVEYYRKIYNKLKHTSNAIQPINFHINNSAIMGFYVQGVADDGSLGPDEEIYPKYQGTHSASSYNFTLKNLYYLLYKISDCLKDVIINHFKEVHNVDLTFNEDYKIDSKNWKELFEQMQKLPNTCFPNEFNQTTYDFKEDKESLIFTAIKQPTINVYGRQITFMESGDGFTRLYRMPFFNPKY